MNKRPFVRSKRYPRRHFKTPIIRPGADARLKRVFSSIGVPAQGSFKPDPFQIEALAAIEKSDCLVTVPTGSGKTWIAQQAISRIFEKGGRAWYASPLKALSNSKYSEFEKIFGLENVGILTGDRKENPDAPITVGTTEILRNQLYDAMHQGESLSADLVVLDEAHFLGDPDRGVVWEEIIIYLPVRIPLLLLSATIGNAHQIAEWISTIRSKKCVVIEETKRPVPLFPLFFHPSGMLLPLLSQKDQKGKKILDKKIKAYLKNERPPLLAPPRKLPPFGEILRVLKKYRLLPAIFFLKSRSDCDGALERCVENLRNDQNRKAILGQRISELVAQHPYIGRHRQLWHLEHLAVGAHHSGQLPVWKLVLETLMTEGLLNAVFATSTVAAGVNFPARTIVFLNSDRFNGKEFLPLNPTEFHQMTGRAGRRGMDNIGFAVAIPGKFMDIRLYAKLMTMSSSDVLSQIRINFSMVLNLLLSHTPAQIERLLEKSFATHLILKKRKRGRHTEPGHDAIKYLWRDFQKHLKFLRETGYATKDGKLTETGLWASQLRVDHPLMIAEGLRRGILPELEPEMLAAVIASFVDEQESEEHVEKKLAPPKLVASFLKVTRELKSFAKYMASRGFDTKTLYFRPAVTVYAWATGHPWEKVSAISETAEGDLAMLILRTADNLRHISTLTRVFPEAANTSAKAIELILRNPVLMDYDL